MKLSLERTCVAPRVGQGSVGNVSAAIQALPVGVARIATERWLYRFSAYRALVVLVPLQKQYLGTTLRPSSLSPNTCVAVLREVSKASARWYHWNYHGGGTNAAQSLEKHTKTPRVRRWRKHIRCTNVASAIPLLCFSPSTPYWCNFLICTTSSNSIFWKLGCAKEGLHNGHPPITMHALTWCAQQESSPKGASSELL